MHDLVGTVIIIIIVFSTSRYGSCYPERGLLKKYIRIKNDLAVDVFISRNHGRYADSMPEDRDKMCIVGAISYLYFALTIIPFLWGGSQASLPIEKMCNMIFWINVPITLFFTVLNDFDGFVYRTGSHRKEYKHWIVKFGNIFGTIILLLILLIYLMYITIELYESIGVVIGKS